MNIVNLSPMSLTFTQNLSWLRFSFCLAEKKGLLLCKGLNVAATQSLIIFRFNMSITGMCAIEDEHISVFRCTSIGDIFQQKIRSDNNSNGGKKDLSLEDCTLMSEWEKKCELIFRKCKSENLATHVTSVNHVFESEFFYHIYYKIYIKKKLNLFI
jgi:hypothetical protein